MSVVCSLHLPIHVHPVNLPLAFRLKIFSSVSIATSVACICQSWVLRITKYMTLFTTKVSKRIPYLNSLTDFIYISPPLNFFLICVVNFFKSMKLSLHFAQIIYLPYFTTMYLRWFRFDVPTNANNCHWINILPPAPNLQLLLCIEVSAVSDLMTLFIMENFHTEFDWDTTFRVI